MALMTVRASQALLGRKGGRGTLDSWLFGKHAPCSNVEGLRCLESPKPLELEGDLCWPLPTGHRGMEASETGRIHCLWQPGSHVPTERGNASRRGRKDQRREEGEKQTT